MVEAAERDDAEQLVIPAESAWSSNPARWVRVSRCLATDEVLIEMLDNRDQPLCSCRVGRIAFETGVKVFIDA